MIVVVDAGSQQIAGAMMMQAYMYGIEVEKLYDNQLEFWSADDERLERFLTKYPSKVLHRESIKIVD
jgi:hypothetical protein